MEFDVVNLDDLSNGIESPSYTQGVCQTMCPKHETELREREGLLHRFEISEGKNKNGKSPVPDVRRTVKQFSRPAAGQSPATPDDLRPFPVLKATVKYLYENIIPLQYPAWSVVYTFVFDRLRAVRQDMVIQGIMGPEAIFLLEQVVRFHLYAAYRLRESPTRDFDPVINKQHLLECLKRLLYLYQVTPGIHENREEFESVYLLDNLGDIHAMTHCLHLYSSLRRKSLLSLCFEINTSFLQGNYSRCLRLAKGLDSVSVLCALHPQLDNLRINLLQLLSVAYHVKNCAAYPVDKLQHQLALVSEADVLDLCARCSLTDPFLGSDVVCFNKTKFCRPQKSQAISYKGDFFVGELEKQLAKASLSHFLLCGEKSLTITQKEGQMLPPQKEDELSYRPEETKSFSSPQVIRPLPCQLAGTQVCEQQEAKLSNDLRNTKLSGEYENVPSRTHIKAELPVKQEEAKVKSENILKEARFCSESSQEEAKIVNMHGQAKSESANNQRDAKIQLVNGQGEAEKVHTVNDQREAKMQSVNNIGQAKTPRRGRGCARDRKPLDQRDGILSPSVMGRSRGRGRRKTTDSS